MEDSDCYYDEKLDICGTTPYQIKNCGDFDNFEYPCDAHPRCAYDYTNKSCENIPDYKNCSEYNDFKIECEKNPNCTFYVDDDTCRAKPIPNIDCAYYDEM